MGIEIKIDRSADISQPLEELHENERLKANSRHLRGTIEESLQNTITGAISEEDTKLLKFHGMYMQDERDLRNERRRSFLEPSYQFMMRVRLPGGLCLPRQWLALDKIARDYGSGTIRLTTRQTVQIHGIRKHHLRSAIQTLRSVYLDTIAACGDDSRGVMCSPNPYLSGIHATVYAIAKETSQRLIPGTGAYRELWYGVPETGNMAAEEPVYGEAYLPRKFKVGYCIPPDNDIDVFTQDLGYIAVVEEGELTGFNFCVGGGMGNNDQREDTYPLVARMAGFVPADEAPHVAQKVMEIQRDYGNRKDRDRARFKYTVERLGVAFIVEELSRRVGWEIEPPRPYQLLDSSEDFDWHESENGLWHRTLHIASGRVGGPAQELMDQLREIAAVDAGKFRLTPNQNLAMTDVAAIDKDLVDDRLRRTGMLTPVRARAISCVALPTCGLAMAESERYLPALLDEVERIMDGLDLSETPLDLRVTGCPNGCARPYVAELALTGRAPGKYNLYIGGSHLGTRLNDLYRENIGEAEILQSIRDLLRLYRQEREAGERVGDFLHRYRPQLLAPCGED